MKTRVGGGTNTKAVKGSVETLSKIGKGKKFPGEGNPCG